MSKKPKAQKRHICGVCGRKRNEDKMRSLGEYNGEYFQADKRITVFACIECPKKSLPTRLAYRVARI
jgi:hypothetical protein